MLFVKSRKIKFWNVEDGLANSFRETRYLFLGPIQKSRLYFLLLSICLILRKCIPHVLFLKQFPIE